MQYGFGKLELKLLHSDRAFKPTLTYSHSFFSLTLIEQVGHRCSNNGAITHSSHNEVKVEEVL